MRSNRSRDLDIDRDVTNKLGHVYHLLGTATKTNFKKYSVHHGLHQRRFCSGEDVFCKNTARKGSKRVLRSIQCARADEGTNMRRPLLHPPRIMGGGTPRSHGNGSSSLILGTRDDALFDPRA
ncbi:hypothetical protein NPIL_365751 [Nephila pilipes]|uniref:Uncharacterized protein n=1 Tax=Nephila pilipes TaxID=299642 RepID=A0A8X6M9H7_NEPPI|nr:hypothetical protein NPIL_365751 [Nephila pilipes]